MHATVSETGSVTLRHTSVDVYPCGIGISEIRKATVRLQNRYQSNPHCIILSRHVYLELSTSSAKAPNKNSWVVLKSDDLHNSFIKILNYQNI